MRILLSIVCVVLAAVTGEAVKWDGLSATWGTNPLVYPHLLPRTVKDAESMGFRPTLYTSCEEELNYYGIAYHQENFDATVIFDVNGYIAGIQAGIDLNEAAATGFPTEQLKPPFVQDGFMNDRWVITAYFTDPATICTTGRSKADFDRDGTGTQLWLQNGEDYIKVPLTESEAKVDPWVEGNCFWTMGKHYWYDISKDMDCDALFPIFLLYNKGELNAFGWAFAADLEGDYYEHPTPDEFGYFMKDVPSCLETRGTVSTMHVFLTSNPLGNEC